MYELKDVKIKERRHVINGMITLGWSQTLLTYQEQ